MNVHWVVVLFSGGGDTSPLYVLIELFLAAGGGDPKTKHKFVSTHLAPCLAPLNCSIVVGTLNLGSETGGETGGETGSETGSETSHLVKLSLPDIYHKLSIVPIHNEVI